MLSFSSENYHRLFSKYFFIFCVVNVELSLLITYYDFFETSQHLSVK